MDNIIKNAVDIFLSLDKDKVLRVVTHNDTDGLTSGAIISKALIRENIRFVINSVKQLDETTLKNLSNEVYDVFIFTDLGSGYLRLIKKYFSDKKVFILDHHEIDDFNTDDFDNCIIHVNPKLVNEDDYNYSSGAGIVYLFVKCLNNENVDLSYLALIGALGDLQDLNKGINRIILEDAIKSKKIEIKKGLKLFGYQSRAIHKILQYSSEPYIPGVSGNEINAINFLNELGISIMDKNNSYRKLTDLSKDEMQKLVAGIIIKRIGVEKEPEDVIGDLYLLNEEEDDSFIKDIKEFSTVLNCCGKLDAFSVGVGLCFGNRNIKNKAEALLRDYRLELIRALNYFYENKENFIKGDNFIIVNTKDKINDNIIGTLLTILSKNDEFKGIILIGMAYRGEDIKISARVSGNSDIDLRELLISIASDYGIVGGHKMACGGLINRDKEELFLNRAFDVLSNMQIMQR